MGGSAIAQFLFGLGQGDVEPLFAVPRAFKQKLQRHGGLTGTGSAFQQEYVSFGKTTAEDVVQSPDAGFRPINHHDYPYVSATNNNPAGSAGFQLRDCNTQAGCVT